MRFSPFKFSKRSIHEENEISNEKPQQLATDNVDLERGEASSLDNVSSDSDASVQEQQGQKKRSRWTGGVSTKNRKIVRIFGQVGFCAKGLVYG